MITQPIGPDDGGYLGADNKPNKPFAKLRSVGLASFFICKGAQNIEYINTLDNMKAARDAGILLVGCYYWFYPHWDLEQQIAFYKAAIELEKPDFIAVDIEQPVDDGDSPAAYALCKALHELFPHLPFFIYTSQSVIDSFMPSANAWIGEFEAWICSWPGYGIDDHSLQYLSPEQIRGIADGHTPYMPKGWAKKKWTFWQFATWPRPDLVNTNDPSMLFMNHQYDWNMFNGTEAEMYALFGIVIADTSTPEERWMWGMDAWARSKGYNGIRPDGGAAVYLPVAVK